MRPARPILIAAAFALLAAPLAAGVNLSLSFSLPGSALAGIVDGIDADLDCHPELSPPGRAAFEEVRREGGQGAASFIDDEGKLVRFRRDGDAFRILTRDDDGRAVRVEIPWGLALCALGGVEPDPGAARRLRGHELQFDLVVKDDRVEIVLAKVPN